MNTFASIIKTQIESKAAGNHKQIKGKTIKMKPTKQYSNLSYSDNSDDQEHEESSTPAESSLTDPS